MGIKFIYGRAGSGKSEFCLNEIKNSLNENSNFKIILLVPDQYRFQTEKKLLDKLGEKAQLRVEVLSFKRMANRVFDVSGGIVKNIVRTSGRNMLIYKLLKDNSNDLKYFNKISKKKGFVDVISKTITEFKKYNISNEDLDNLETSLDNEELKAKIFDLKNIYEKFNNKLHENYIDTDDILNLLLEKLETCTLYNNSQIFIDEFTTFTPQQLNLINVLNKKARDINITLCSDNLIGENNYENDIFRSIKNTKDRIVRIIESNELIETIDLNKGNLYRFKDNNELKHLEKFFFNYPLVSYNEECNNIKIYKANNSYNEIEYVAKSIINFVRDHGYRYKDIAVVCRNIESYDKITRVIFDEYDIPYFLDKKRNILDNPLVVLITSMIEIIITNWSYESVFKYLKSGLIKFNIPNVSEENSEKNYNYSTRDYIDELENYILSNGIKGSNWNGKSFKNEEDITQKDELFIEMMNMIRTPINNFKEKIDSKSKVIDYCSALYEFLIEINSFEIMDELIENFRKYFLFDKVNEYSQVSKIVIEILDSAVEVLGNETIDNKTFLSILISGLEEQEIGVIPMSLDEVNIGDIARIKGRDVKALFIIGANDGILPSLSKKEGILSDDDRINLKNLGFEIASDNKSRISEEQFMVYTALTIPSKYLVITYPMSDFEGKALRASIIVPKIKNMFKNLKEESDLFDFRSDKYKNVTSPKATFNYLIESMRENFDNKEIESYWKDVFRWFEQNDDFNYKLNIIENGIKYSNLAQKIDRQKLKKLYSNENNKLAFNVSRIEKYAQCPFSYYVKYGLKAKERKLYEFKSPDIGSFMHEIIEKFSDKIIKEEILWKDLSKEQCSEIVSDLIKQKLDENKNYILNSSKKYMYFSERFKKTITKSVNVITEHMKRGEFEIFETEYEFGSKDSIKLELSSNDIITLKGRVDRIDKLTLDKKTYIRIIDYKTGTKKFDLNEVLHGLQIQLLVYLDAILKNSEDIIKTQCMPGAILYFKIDDPIIKSKKALAKEEIEEEILKKLKLDGLLLKDANVVRAMDNTMDKFSLIIPAKFKNDGDFDLKSSVITNDQFNILRNYVNNKMIELCEEMISGDIKIQPCKTKSFSYCEYCDYSSICQFDTSLKDNNYKIINKKDKEDIWEEINKKVVIKGEYNNE